MDFKEKNQKAYGIIKDIDNFIKSHDLFKLSRDVALDEIMVNHSELCFYWMMNRRQLMNISNRYAKFEISDYNMEAVVQESLKWLVRWAFKHCPLESDLECSISIQDFMDMFELAYVYNILYEQWWSFRRKRLDIHVDDNLLRFINRNRNEKYFIAYNYWRRSIRDEQTYKRVKQKARSNDEVISMLNEIQKREFQVTHNWEFDGFNYNDMKVFNISLDRYLNETNVPKTKTIVIENMKAYQRNALVRMPKNMWAEVFARRTNLNTNVINSLIDILTYTGNEEHEISHKYFVPINNDLVVHSRFVGISLRPERNFLSMLAKDENSILHKISNDFEDVQKGIIISELLSSNSTLLFAEAKTQEQKIRPGMDLLVLDTKTYELVTVELKYNIPASTAQEVMKVDKKMKDGVDAIVKAKEFIENNRYTILQEYFGNQFHEMTYSDLEAVVITNEEIGLGSYVDFNAPILTIDHFIEIVNDSLKELILTIRNGFRGYPNDDLVESEIEIEINGIKIIASSFKPNTQGISY